MHKQKIINIRNAVFEAGDGASLDDVMMGTIMAQGKLIASIVRDPEEARSVAQHYYDLLIEGIPAYCSEFECSPTPQSEVQT